MLKTVRTVCAASLALGLVSGVPGLVPRSPVASAEPTPQAGGQRGRGAPPAIPTPDPRLIIDGADDHDDLTGGDQGDWIFGRGGADFLIGGAGADNIDAGEGDDRIEGGDDADVIAGHEGSDTILGGAGDDVLDGGDDHDLIDGGDGDDDIDGGDGEDTIRGGPGNDRLAGGDENDSLNGEAGNDHVAGNDGNDTLAGGAGDDVLQGGDGEDTLAGDAGDDRLDGGAGNDLLRGDQGDDELLGSAGTDSLLGGPGHDVLLGGDGDDTIDGGAGFDWLFGGTGRDVVSGGEGDDLLFVRAGDVGAGEVEMVNGGEGTDVLFLAGFDRLVALSPDFSLEDPATGGRYVVVDVERIEYTVMVTPMASPGEQTVSVLLVNPSEGASEGRLVFFGPEGELVPAARDGGQPADDIEFRVPGNGSVRVTATVPGPAVAQVFSASPLGVAAMPASGPGALPAPIADTALVPVIEDQAAGISTGVIVANSVTDTSLKFTLRGLSGDELDSGLFVGTAVVDLPAYGHRTLFARELFPRLENFRGSMTIEGGLDRPQEGGPVAMTLMERHSDGGVALLPAAPIGPAAAEGRPTFVPRIDLGTDDEGARALVLMNPAAAPSRGTIRFFDELGQPWPVSVNGAAPSETAAFDLGGFGSATFALTAAGPARQGVARIDAERGAVTAFRRAGSGTSLALLPASGAQQAAVAAVRVDATTAGVTTVTLASTGSPATLRLHLRAGDGADVDGGTSELRLPASGQVTRTIRELFPAADVADFEGSLLIDASDGSVATLITLQAADGRVSVLPAIRIR